MADQVVDSLIVEIRMRTEALERGLSAAEARIDDFTRKSTNSAKQQASAAKASAQEQAAAHAAVAAAATAAFAVIVGAIKSGIDAANQYKSALTGLRSITEGTGQNFSTMQAALNELTADGLIPVSDAATALKNLLSRGFEAKEAVDILTRLKDSAAYGRQASLSLGEAVRSATEGLKNENSILVDNAGVTKNVSQMWKEYAQQLGKGVDSLTIAEKRQAEYNGIMQETRFQIGDAAKYAASFAGTQAELQASTLRTEQAFGSAVQGGLRPFMEMLRPLVGGLGDLINQNPALVSAITTGIVAFTGLTAAVKLTQTAVNFLSTAFTGMGATLGWIGLAAGVIGILVGIATASNEAADASQRLTQELRETVTAAREEQAALKGYLELEEKGASHKELTEARDKIIQQSPELIAAYTAEGEAILFGKDAIKEKIDQMDKYIKMQQDAIRAAADTTIADAAKKQQEAFASEQEALAAYNKEIEELAKWSGIKTSMEANQQNELDLGGGFTVSFGDVEDRITGILDRMEEYRQAWRDARTEQEQAAAAISGTNAVLMQDHIDSLGELGAVRQYVAEQTMQFALQEQLSQEQFISLLAARLENERGLYEAEAQMKQSALENSEAVKEWADSEKGLENIRKANTAVAEAQKIKNYVKTIKEGKEGTKEYSEAKKALVKAFGGEEDAVKANADGYEALADQSLKGAIDAQSALKASLQSAINDLTKTKGATDSLVVALQALLDNWDLLTGGTTKTGGGGGTRKKAWEEELEMIQRVMDADDEYAQQYLEHIESLLQNDRLSKSERARLEKERQYAQMAVNNELAQAHIEYLENLLRRERLNAEQRLDIEQQLFEAKRNLMSQYDDFADAISSAITARAEAQRDKQLASIQDQIDAVSKWENRQTDAIRTTMNERLDAISAEIRALDDLAKANDRADKDEEDADRMRRLQAQLAFEKDERNRQKLLEQIAALETSINKRKEQEKLDDQKQALKDQQDTIRTESEAQIQIIQEQAEQERDALNRRLKAAQAYWDSRLSMESIQQEALQFLNEASQQEIIALLEQYAPEYLNKGKLLGSQLYGGLKPKIDAVIAEIGRLRTEAEKPIIITTIHRTVYESVGGGSKPGSVTGPTGLAASIAAFAAAPEASFARMVNTAQQAMGGFAYRSIQPAAMAAQNAFTTGNSGRAIQQRSVNVKQTVVLQQPVPSPYQTARALRRESEQLAKLL